MSEITSGTMKTSDTRKKLVAGFALIVIGLLALAGQFITTAGFASLTVLALGLIFLAWGFLAKVGGLFIPGGILTGLGTGIYLVQGPLSRLTEEAQGGAVVLSLAAGFGLITLITGLFARPVRMWPLIPGAILAIVGAALFAGGKALELLELAGKGWPLVLIATGLYLILWRKGLQTAK